MKNKDIIKIALATAVADVLVGFALGALKVKIQNSQK